MRDRNDQWAVDRTGAENFFVLHTRMEFIYTEFLVQKTLVHRTRVPSTDLIDVSRRLLSTLLVVSDNRQRLGSYGALDLSWLVSYSPGPLAPMQ